MSRVRSWPLFIGGGLLAAVGSVWALQGAGVIGRSVMTDQRQWLVIGALMFVVGGALMLRGVRTGPQ